MGELLAEHRPASHQALAARGRSAPGKVTGRLKRALDAMVWEGLMRKQAAETANLSEHSLHVALRRPRVRRYYLEGLDQLRLSARARNIHVLEEIREGAGNAMTRVTPSSSSKL
jgi:hypothetical protein